MKPHALAASLLVLATTSFALADAPPSRKTYLETLLATTRGALSNMTHHERNGARWTQATWETLDSPQALQDWFEDASKAQVIAARLRLARQQTQGMLFTGVSEEAQAELLAGLESLEARVFKHALRGTFDESCVTFGSTTRALYLEPNGDSPRVATLPSGQYATLLEPFADGWAQVRYFSNKAVVRGFVHDGTSTQVYAAPVDPPALLSRAQPRLGLDRHYLRVLEQVAPLVLSNLPHPSRAAAHAARTHWESIDEVDGLLAFFASQLPRVDAYLRLVRERAAHLVPLPAERLAKLSAREARVLRAALRSSAEQLTGTFEDSSSEWQRIYVAPGSELLRTQARRTQHLVVLEDRDDAWVHVRWWDGDYPAEGYMYRGSRFRLQAPPASQADAADPTSGFVDALLRGR